MLLTVASGLTYKPRWVNGRREVGIFGLSVIHVKSIFHVPCPLLVVFLAPLQIVLTAIPRLIAPTEVAAGPLYVLLAFAGVVINLVGVVFFLHLHPSGLWGAHNHCQGHECVRIYL